MHLLINIFGVMNVFWQKCTTLPFNCSCIETSTLFVLLKETCLKLNKIKGAMNTIFQEYRKTVKLFNHSIGKTQFTKHVENSVFTIGGFANLCIRNQELQYQ